MTHLLHRNDEANTDTSFDKMMNIRNVPTLLCCFFLVLSGQNTLPAATVASSADALIAAAAKGDNVRIRHLLQAGVPVDTKGEHGPALVYASEYGHLSTVKMLLAAGAHLHACDEETSLFGDVNNSALWQAASEGHTDVVRYLLHKGLNKDARNDNGYNPLLAAASGQHWQTVRLLLEHGANPNLQTRHYQNSALILAARYGNKDMVQLLLSHGADVDLEDLNEHTALRWARFYKHHTVARMLKKAGAKR